MSSSKDDIKTMKLYTHLDRIQRELQDAGVVHMTAETLSDFDSMHYLGNKAIRQSIAAADITEKSKVLDIGSGFGGPARLLAEWVQCRVDALELQPDVHEAASDLTKQCNLQSNVTHYCGNILGDNTLPKSKKYDAIVSWLVFLHISNRKALFEKCWERLVPGGKMYVEDFYRIAPFSERERALLSREVYVQHELPYKSDLRQELENQGFCILDFTDMTDTWRDFVEDREKSFADNLDKHERLHGKEATAALHTFYKAVNELFQGGKLGGVAYTVEKPTKGIAN